MSRASTSWGRTTLLALVALGLLAACGDDDSGPTPPAGGDAAAPGHDAGMPIDAGPVTEGAWSIVVLPDTQILARSYPHIFRAQTAWIASARRTLDIRYVLHVGDITDDNGSAQWDVAREAIEQLDGVVPYVLVPGNHDLGPGGSSSDRSTGLDEAFPVSAYASLESFGGVFEPDSLANSYHVFETPQGPQLVVGLEFGPRAAVLAWARDVIERHAMPTTIVTHAYLYSDDTRYDVRTRADQAWSPYHYGVASQPGGVSDGEEIFQTLVAPFDQVDFVFSGHVLNDGLGRLTSTQQGGGVVHQLLANYQEGEQGGAGFLRILTFRADGSAVDVVTYSPYLDAYLRDADNEFTLTR